MTFGLPLYSILPVLQCPRCGDHRLTEMAPGIRCGLCAAGFSLRDGILDMLGESAGEVITPFQRVMQTPLIASVYEKAWRRIGYFLASSRSFSREIETVLRYKGATDDAWIIDLACGPGVFTRPLARGSAGIVVGFDLSWPMLAHARQSVVREGLTRVFLIRGTVFRMPFRSGSFSYINCCGALHLFDRPDDALLEITRVLVPGGRLCVQTTIRPGHSGGFAWLLERFIRFGFFEEDDLRLRLDRNGFEICRSERHRISYTFLARKR